MRYLTVRLEPDGGGFHPLGEKLTAEPSIRRRAIHRIELLSDDTVLLLAEASGNRERYREIMEASPRVEDYLVAGADRWMAVSRFEPTAASRRALERQRESNVVVETPIRFASDGAVEITFLGTDEAFADLFEDEADSGVGSVELLDTGDFDPEESSFSRAFTSRQEEVLEAAVELGYYREPRRATLEDVGDAVGIAPATVGEHLRKVEARVFTELVR